MVEITSPGKLLPSIEFNDMEARQSDIRNKVIAPFFKHLGLIDQWGNGLKLIADELKQYPGIGLRWSEVGLQFQVQFVINDFVAAPAKIEEAKTAGLESGLESNIESALANRILAVLLNGEKSKSQIANNLGHTSISSKLNLRINELLDQQFIARTLPDKPNSRLQQYRLTDQGKAFFARKGSNKT
ncbi:MAG: ATP-dependent DNA helicase RecG [Candidatus Endobugula sp.]|jgi:ATP-dependent DNA helicase RecG